MGICSLKWEQYLFMLSMNPSIMIYLALTSTMMDAKEPGYSIHLSS